jgi:hypothetical protein
VRQDTGDDCPTCLFIRVRADRADQRGMIALSVDEVAELRARDAGDAAINHYGRPRVFRIAVMGPDYAAICRLRCSS